MPRSLHVLALVLVISGCEDRADRRALEDRLLAPCCGRQTLRDHESPLATELRAEIARRLDTGESPDDIERDLIRRYGEQIQSSPPSDWTTGAIVGFAMIAGLLVLVRVARRFRSEPPSTPARELDRDEADRLDDELALVD